MNEQAEQRLTALMDAQVDEFELRKAVEEMTSSPEKAEQWRRYHLAQSALHGELDTASTVDPTVDLSGSIMAAIDSEPAIACTVPQQEKKREPTRKDFWKPVASMAVAASVTAIVILGAQRFSGQTDAQLAANQPAFTLPSPENKNQNLMQAQFGSRATMETDSGTKLDIIRLSQGLSRYIDQHQTMLTGAAPQWKAGWVPDGFRTVKHAVTADAEVMLFSDGRNSVSVCIEDFGRQTVTEGVAQAKGMIAVGKRQGSKFVTVVGDVPLALAEQIAGSIKGRI